MKYGHVRDAELQPLILDARRLLRQVTCSLHLSFSSLLLLIFMCRACFFCSWDCAVLPFAFVCFHVLFDAFDGALMHCFCLARLIPPSPH